MGIVLHSDGHLTVKMLYEQIWPRIAGDEIEFVHCYDAILRSHGDRRLDRIYVLSPARQKTDGIFEPIPPEDTHRFNWCLTRSDGAGVARRVGFVGVPGDNLEFGVQELRTYVRSLDLLSRLDEKSACAFLGTDMTLAEVVFADGLAMEPFDPERPDDTTYWIRMTFAAQLEQMTAEAFPFGPAKGRPVMYVSPCSLLSPTQVLALLSSQLEFLAGVTSLGMAASRARVEILDNVFSRTGTSTRIEDHRISIVTGPSFLILNEHAEGDCAFLATTMLRDADQKMLAHTSMAVK